jgi:branched-subunit amino acid transport protein
MLIAAVLALAVGTYAFRVTGVLLRDRIELPPLVRNLLPVAAAVLLAALAATAAMTESGGFAGYARPAGVLVGLLLAWRRAPFVLVVLAAAGTAAVLRLLGVP